jgi:hypothetical protein
MIMQFMWTFLKDSHIWEEDLKKVGHMVLV